MKYFIIFDALKSIFYIKNIVNNRENELQSAIAFNYSTFSAKLV